MKPDVWRVPLIVRGKIIEECTLEFPGAGRECRFLTPDASAHVERLAARPADMADLIGLRAVDVFDYLDGLSERLVIQRNPHMQHAYEMARHNSMLSDDMLREMYAKLPLLFRRDFVQHRTATLLGGDQLDRWVEPPRFPLARTCATMRAFGARTLHIVAGNTPVIGPITVLNNAITRGDAIIKSPSNDPLTTAAVARTMIEMAPSHPLTRHVTVAYWKGGDARVEHELYDPRRIEKIVAWGGLGSIRHVTGHLQPGIELITLDPKIGVAIIDASSLKDTAALLRVAAGLALDIGSMNQEACFNTRLVYVVGGGVPDDIALATRLAELTFENLQALPPALSTPHREFDPELKAELDALRLLDLGHEVIGGRHNEGALIVSHCRKPVDFAHRLACRVANVVPVRTLCEAQTALNNSVQTLCVYPESLKERLRDSAALHAVQRLVSVGGAMIDPFLATPQDGMELLRRMCKWTVEERPAGARASST